MTERDEGKVDYETLLRDLRSTDAFLSESAADAIESLLAEREWRPISEAPRDGTPILLSGNGVVGPARWSNKYQAWDVFSWGAAEFTPTLWTDLPPAPKQEKDRE